MLATFTYKIEKYFYNFTKTDTNSMLSIKNKPAI